MRRDMATTLVASLAIGMGTMLAHSAAPSAAPVTPKTQAPPEARALSQAFSNAAKALRPSVVRIEVETEQPRQARRGRGQQPDMREFFERFFEGEGGGAPFAPPGGQGPGRGTGSGVVLDGQGNILTNSHVVQRASKVTVQFSDGRELPAKVVGFDDQTDVAVVRLEKPPGDLVAARIGDSTKVEIG